MRYGIDPNSHRLGCYIGYLRSLTAEPMPAFLGNVAEAAPSSERELEGEGGASLTLL